MNVLPCLVAVLQSEHCLLFRAESLCGGLHHQLSLPGDVAIKVLYPTSFHHGIGLLADIVGNIDAFLKYLGLLGFVSILASLLQFLENHLILSQALDGSGRYKGNISELNLYCEQTS